MKWWFGKRRNPTADTPPQGLPDFALGLEHHQAGRLQEAEAIYHAVLAKQPDHFDAAHLLGVIALQTGRLQEAAQRIEGALLHHSQSAAAYNNLGTTYLRLGRPGDAMRVLGRAIEIEGDFASAYFNLGLACVGMGDQLAAKKHFVKAIALDPHNASAHNHLGALALNAGRPAEALHAFEAALRVNPDEVDAQANRGTALVALGRTKEAGEAFQLALGRNSNHVQALSGLAGLFAKDADYSEAERLLRHALQVDSSSALIHVNLGSVLRESGRPDEALDCFVKATSIDASLAIAQANKALAFFDLGRYAEALAANQRALAIDPKLAKAQSNLGVLAIEQRRFGEALEHLRTAIALDPQDAEAHLNLGNALRGLANATEARQSYRTASRLDPEYTQAQWALTMSQIAPMYADDREVIASREAFAKALAELSRWFDARPHHLGERAVGTLQPFYLAYHDAENRALLAQYGQLCTRLMARSDRPPPVRPTIKRPGRIRVGVASAQVRSHSVWNAIAKGWVDQLNRTDFELHIFHLGHQRDAETDRVAASVDRFDEGRRPFRDWTRAIAEAQIDVLIYPEIGMDATTVKLAAQRLAPVQVATWGHPETTGLPSVDYFLSGEDFEPADAPAHYTEKLVQLPHLGTYYLPLPVTPSSLALDELGLDPTRPMLICAGSPFKYGPKDDWIWPEIARRAADVQLVFFRSTPPEFANFLSRRLEAAFAKAGVAYTSHVRWIPFQTQSNFYGLLGQAHGLLDTLGFSGFNTAMQAIETGLPVIAREGRFLRGRLASGILRRMGMPELVAESDQAFIGLAVQMASDRDYQRHWADKTVMQREQLFRDEAVIKGLAAFLSEVV